MYRISYFGAALMQNWQEMWISTWQKFGVELYIRLAGFDSDTLLFVLFVNFALVQDVLNVDSKGQFYCFIACFVHILKKGKRKVQGVPQSQTADLPRTQEEEETDKSKQAQIEQTY